VTGGKQLKREGFFVEPTLFTNVKDDMKIAQEEIFGPVLCVMKFKEVDEVIARANSSCYGLTGAVFSKN
jgi:acyl-CoA reductase-like NAD-dependent aldehyde dehydrogenase